MMASSRKVILSLYRNLIRESKKWNSYNYRMYALRKIRHEFQQNKTIQDKEKINECYNRGLESLQIIKRQVTIGNLYSTRPLIIEAIENKANLN
ncbi:LYR motif-containing protein 4 [Bombus vosnesenskii]|uniref:LYR motif-containing protein 4 n=3 Tax=Pyrobombus TaxID=144703 RepID=A0A6J3K3E4_9HYME|nr:LYR motif-containing protein 4 [Bombus impatiens]XP_033192763.1 LYR motif-containing protein 4 [Bombus vancouverensis nearcticus]XP_033305399.1 LYR motif-containing protein 4 [Bombus bifarius]XP_033347021.1 LYR motif-containing protein 4 [Bombus vosnesenskii]XP_050478759.1 LYR motif-containing protein 4 [Bombus huntii]